MGEQFWWIYDAAAAAIVLICIFVMSKKGAIKGMMSLVCAGVALMIAFTASSAIANNLYESSIRAGNIKTISKDLEPGTVTKKLVEYLDGMDYNLKASGKKIDEMFASDKDFDQELYKYVNNINAKKVAEESEFLEKAHEGYAQIISSIIGRELSPYAAKESKQLVMNNPSYFKEIGSLNTEEGSQREAAALIADNYLAPTYHRLIRYISFMALFIFAGLLLFLIVKAFTGKEERVGAVSHIIGGLSGIGFAVVVLVVIAVMIRLYILLGSNEMMIFNKETLEKTYVFKHIYNIVADM